MKYLIVTALFLILSLLIIFPFLPGDFDPVANPVSTVIQLWSIFGVFVCLPALLWLIRTRKASLQITTADDRFLRSAKATIRTGVIAMIPVILFTFLSISTVIGLVFVVGVVLLRSILLRSAMKMNTVELSSAFTPTMIICIQLWLLCFPLMFHEPLTCWSRHAAIANSQELIADIEAYAERTGFYPSTMNGTWKDYYPNVMGVEKYHYTYDDSTYHLFFRQPRFFLDHIGTDEYVVYNPKGNHMILSHSAWNLDFTPQQRRANQGWYKSNETPCQNWKYFWFD